MSSRGDRYFSDNPAPGAPRISRFHNDFHPPNNHPASGGEKYFLDEEKMPSKERYNNEPPPLSKTASTRSDKYFSDDDVLPESSSRPRSSSNRRRSSASDKYFTSSSDDDDDDDEPKKERIGDEFYSLMRNMKDKFHEEMQSLKRKKRKLMEELEDPARHMAAPAAAQPDHHQQQQRRDAIVDPEFALVAVFNPDETALSAKAWLGAIDKVGLARDWSPYRKMAVMRARLGGRAKLWLMNQTDANLGWEEWKRNLAAAFPSRFNYAAMVRDILARVKLPAERMSSYYYAKSDMCRRAEIAGEKAVSMLIDGLPAALQFTALSLGYTEPDELFNKFLVRLDGCDAHQPGPGKLCHACKGPDKHLKRDCPMMGVKCTFCGKPGHVAEMCFRAKRQAPPPLADNPNDNEERPPHKEAPACWVCGEPGHQKLQCPKLDRNSSHEAPPAPAHHHDGGGYKEKLGPCWTCGKMGHRSFDCFHRKEGMAAAGDARPPEDDGKGCWTCKKPGHRAFECPERGYDDVVSDEEAEYDGRSGGRDEGRACWTCGKPGHQARECPDEDRPRYRDASGSYVVKDGFKSKADTCRACGEPGHHAIDCDAPGRQSKDSYSDSRVKSQEAGFRNVRETSKKMECWTCGGFGHQTKECYHEEGRAIDREIGMHLVGASSKENVCWICDKPGHNKRNCPEDRRSRSFDSVKEKAWKGEKHRN